MVTFQKDLLLKQTIQSFYVSYLNCFFTIIKKMVHRRYLFQIWNQMGEISFSQALSLDLKPSGFSYFLSLSRSSQEGFTTREKESLKNHLTRSLQCSFRGEFHKHTDV